MDKFIEGSVAVMEEIAIRGGVKINKREDFTKFTRDSLVSLLAEIEKEIKDARGDDELWDDYTYLKILNILRPSGGETK